MGKHDRHFSLFSDISLAKQLIGKIIRVRRQGSTTYSCTIGQRFSCCTVSNKRDWLWSWRTLLGSGVTDRPCNRYNWAPCHITLCLFCSDQFVMFWFHCLGIKMIIWVSTEVCKTQLLLVDENVTYNKHLHLHIMLFYFHSWHVIKPCWCGYTKNCIWNQMLRVHQGDTIMINTIHNLE